MPLFIEFFSNQWIKKKKKSETICSLLLLRCQAWMLCFTLQAFSSLRTKLKRRDTLSSFLTRIYHDSLLFSGNMVPFFLSFDDGWWIALFFRNFFNLFWKFWCRTAKLRLCADGGANRVYDELPLFFPHEDASAIRNRFSLISAIQFVLELLVQLWNQLVPLPWKYLNLSWRFKHWC